jgi:hypothetical protein
VPIRYATIDQVEAVFDARQTSRISSETVDLLFTYILYASRRVEERCRRRKGAFAPCLTTRRYDATGDHILGTSEMELDEPLLVLTALSIDGIAVDMGEVILWPYDEYPKRHVILPDGLTWTWSTTPRAAVEVTGRWGFHKDPENAWPDAGVDVPAGGLAADATSLEMGADVGAIKRGHLLQIDDEWLSVEDIAEVAGPVYTLTLDRGLSGSEAAEHTEGADILYFTPDNTITRAVERTAHWMYEQRNAPFEKIVSPMGVAQIPPGLPNDVVTMLKEGGYVRSVAGTLYVVE